MNTPALSKALRCATVFVVGMCLSIDPTSVRGADPVFQQGDCNRLSSVTGTLVCDADLDQTYGTSSSRLK